MYSVLRPERPQPRRSSSEASSSCSGVGVLPPKRSTHPQVDRPRRFGRELLADDRPQQRPVGVARAAPPCGASAGSRCRSSRPARSVPPSSGRRRRGLCAPWRSPAGPLRAALLGEGADPLAEVLRGEAGFAQGDEARLLLVAQLRVLRSAGRSRACCRASRAARWRRSLRPGRRLRLPARASSTTQLTRPIRSARSASRLRPVRKSSFVCGEADRVEELAQAGVAVDQAELRRRHPQLGAGGADPQVAGNRQLEAAAEAVAVDRRDRRPGLVGDRLHRRVEGVGDERLGVALEALLGDTGDVVAGREQRRRAGDQDAAGLDASGPAAAGPRRARRGSRGRGRCGARGCRSSAGRPPRPVGRGGACRRRAARPPASTPAPRGRRLR